MKKFYTILALLLTSMYCQAQSPEENLKKLGITLQVPNAPIANYVGYVRTGNLIYLSGSGPDNAFKGVSRGKLDSQLKSTNFTYFWGSRFFIGFKSY